MKKTRFEAEVLSALGNMCGGTCGKHIAVALSGGADSVSLLLALCSLSQTGGFNVSAIHINHMIRGAEADRDEEFCVKLCGSLSVKLYTAHIDVPRLARQSGQSIELCAREQRYKTFGAYSKNYGIDYIATAHNANDNAETVLYNILRGTGLDGICGIPTKRGNIVRPILKMTRAEILSYLNECKQDYVIDSTNLENDYTRNYIRNVLLPSAAKINGDAVVALNKLAHIATVDCEYLNNEVRRFLNTDDCRLSALPPALQARAVRSLCADACGFSPESKHVYAICEGIPKGGEKRFSLSKSCVAVTCNGYLRFEKAGKKPFTLAPTALAVGDNIYADGRVCVELVNGAFKKPIEQAERLFFAASFDKSSIVGQLKLRTRKIGDSFVVRKMSRNVKKCLINKKVPVSLREVLPIIYDDAGILFVPFIGVADRVYNINSTDTYNVRVSIERDG